MKLIRLEDVDRVLADAALLATSRARQPQSSKLVYGSADQNEQSLFRVIEEVCRKQKFTEGSVKHLGGHKFPDIVFPFANVGVEVKCHEKSGGDLVGNSIMATTFSLTAPKAVRLLVWTKSTKSVELHDYFESVVSAQVTHSPRFLLRPGAATEDRLFGNSKDHVGPVDEICLGPDGINHDRILAWMRVRELRKGNIPWWFGDPSQSGNSSGMQAGVAIQKFRDLEAADRIKLEALATFLFPAVVGDSSPTKYWDAIAWAVATRGVLMSRDNFSASGKASIEIPRLCGAHTFVLPKSLVQGHERLKRGVVVSIEEARIYWGIERLTRSSLMPTFAKKLNSVRIEQAIDDVLKSACSKCRPTRDEAEKVLRRYLGSAINVSVGD